MRRTAGRPDCFHGSEESGLDWTFVRPGYFATNSLRWTSIRGERRLRTAFPDATTTPVHELDIAAVAVRALLDDGLRGGAFPVLGPGPVTIRDQVSAISEALDEVDVETYRSELATQLPEFLIEVLIQGRGDVPELSADRGVSAVPELLDRPPLAFARWARDHVADFR